MAKSKRDSCYKLTRDLDKWLYMSGIKNTRLAKLLGMDYGTFKKSLDDPLKYFTLHHLVIISGLTGVKLDDIISYMYGYVRESLVDKPWYGSIDSA